MNKFYSIRNRFRYAWLKGWAAVKAQQFVAGIFGGNVIHGEVSAVLHHDGKDYDLGVLGHRLVTDAFLAFLVDQLQITDDSQTIGNEDTFGFHDAGTGTNNEAAGDTTLQTPWGGARVEGTYTEGATANIFRTVATITFNNTFAITEHGVFSRITAGTLLDRTKHAAINVVNADSITYTYSLTTSGS